MEKHKNIPQLRFPEFSDSWENYKFNKIAEFSKGKGISKADIVEDGAIECIRYGELYTTYGETIMNVKSRTNISEDDLVLSEANDVIIPASGETQIDIATASCVLKSGIALGGDLNIIKSKNNGVFLSYYLNNKKKLDIASLAQGISVVHLYARQLSLLELNLPSIPEQDKISAFISSVDEKLKALMQKKNLLEQYKKGVMQKLFSQELRFKDDKENYFPNWEKKQLGDIGEIKKGEQLNVTELTENGLYPALNGGINASGYTDKWNTEANTIAISEGGNSCGYVNFNKERFWSGGHCYAILNIISSVNANYLFQVLKFNELAIQRLRVGSGLPNIQKKDLNEFHLQIHSTKEQIKIANFLSSIDEKINQTQTQIIKTEQYKKGLLQKMFC